MTAARNIRVAAGPLNRRRRASSGATVFFAVAVLLTACTGGSSEPDAAPVDSPGASTTAATTTVTTAVTTPQATPTSTEPATTTTAPTDTTTTAPEDADDPPVDPVLPNGATIPVVAIDGEVRDTAAPLFGEQNDEGGAAEPTPGYVVDAADAPFCSALDIVNSRPQPRDDFEQLVVAEQYFVAISPIAPAEIAADFSVLQAWAASIVSSGSFTEANAPASDDPVNGAVTSINAFVNERCLGR